MEQRYHCGGVWSARRRPGASVHHRPPLVLLEYVIKWEFRGFRSDTKTGVLVTVLMSVAGLVLGALRTSALCCNKDVNYKLEQPRAAEQLLMSAYHTHTPTVGVGLPCRRSRAQRGAKLLFNGIGCRCR